MKLNEEIYRIKKIIGLITEEDEFYKHMEYGTKHKEVEELQKILKIEVDGKFGPETKECVKKLQDHFKIKIDGVVGPETRNILNNILQGNTNGWEGCETEKKETEVTVVKPESNKIVGAEWNSCKAWNSKGGLSKWGDLFNITKSDTEFKIEYAGPSSGLSIAHAKGGSDTIHQVFNVLICEINPFLFKGGLKPDIESIATTTGKDGKNSLLTITVPLVKEEGTFQLDRRGGWGHDPGESLMSQKCSKLKSEDKICFGPVKNITTGPFGKITEYFIVHQI
jgi:hypothetical protein